MRTWALLSAVLLLAACGSQPAPTSAPEPAAFVPVIVSQEQVVGPNRFLFSLLDAKTNAPAATPDRATSVALIAPGERTPEASIHGHFLWAVTDVAGLYRADVSFPVAGAWQAVVTSAVPSGTPESATLSFDVVDHGSTLRPGTAAPSVDTPTAASVGDDLRRISTDSSPEPRFYEHSIADLLAASTPFVVVFATPAFCRTATCGPTLDHVKRVVARQPDVPVVNVEPYQLQFVDNRLQPILDTYVQLQPVPAVSAFGLLTEPAIFAIDRDGIVRAYLDGPFDDAELDSAIDAIR